MANSGPFSLATSEPQLRELGKLLAYHRHSLGYSQEFVGNNAGIDPSTYSKAERGVRKLSLDVLLRIAEVFKLTHTQEIELVTKAGYDASVIGSTPFDASTYPIVVGSVQDILTGSRGLWPAWAANQDGNIVSANVLALLLWHAVHEDGAPAPERFIEANVWEIIARYENLARIMAPQKASDFFFTVIYVWNKLKHKLPSHVRETFEQAIDNYPVLSHLLHYQTVGVEQEWQFDLNIYPDVPVPFYDKDPISLKFQITVERIFDGYGEHAGYLYTARPLRKSTDDWIRQQYDTFMQTSTPEEFVLGEWDANNKEAALKYPAFYPAVNHDLLWTITLANNEFQLLYGSDPTGKHYFDMLLSPRFLELIRSADEDDTDATFGRVKEKLAIPVRRFVLSTQVFEKKGNPRYDELLKLKARLAKVDKFQILVDEVLRSQQQPPVQSDSDTPCFAITMPCPLTSVFNLSFAVIARQPTKTEADYRVCFVPITLATKAALILMRLHNSLEVKQFAGDHKNEQYMWLLASLRTVGEGFSKKKGDAWWQPEAQFKEFYQLLAEDAFDLAALKAQVDMALVQLIAGGEEWEHRMLELDGPTNQGGWHDGILDMLLTITGPFHHARTLIPS